MMYYETKKNEWFFIYFYVFPNEIVVSPTLATS